MDFKLVLQLAAAASALTAISEASTEQITTTEKPGHVTEATVIVDARPSEVYALVTDYQGWPARLTDVRGVTVERPGRENARVRFSSKVLQHDVTIEFSNEADHVIRFKGIKGPPGGRASGTYTLEPVDGGAHTRVVASLYLDVVGAPSLFVSDAKLRRMRHDKLTADLGDMKHALAR